MRRSNMKKHLSKSERDKNLEKPLSTITDFHLGPKYSELQTQDCQSESQCCFCVANCIVLYSCTFCGSKVLLMVSVIITIYLLYDSVKGLSRY